MDIKLLEDFVCLARQQSFTAASRERNISQPALSRRVKSLEQWLGADLINRKSHQFDLTPQGRIFVPEAELILRRIYNAREAARTAEKSGDHEIAVASQNSIAQTFFPDWVKRVEASLDTVYFRLLSEKLNVCIDLLHQGHVNYLFCYANDTLSIPVDKNRFSYTTVGKETLIPVSAPQAHGEATFTLPGTTDNLTPYVAYTHESIFGRAVDQLIQQKSHKCFLSRRYENAYSHTLKSLVKENLGLAWLPKSTIVSEIQQGELCRAGDERWDIDFDIRLYYDQAVNTKRERIILDTSLNMINA
ncbi:MAG: LysR family transcriptional regulator [Gammaproteobacteria bacterium]|nr:LysR family transcriptional regulator [Gammaproteobacteria bacterium]